MEKIIERLRKEKEELDLSWFEAGKDEGVLFGKTAGYEDLQYALDWEGAGNFETPEFMQSCYPKNDDVLGAYFSEIMDENPLLERGPNWENWEQGWKEGVKAFWDEVKDKLD